MEIRKARKEDIKGILSLLLQVNQIHADGRPDLFKSGGIKYTESNLAEKMNKEGEMILVAVENGEVLGYSFLEIEDTKESTSLYPHRAIYIDDLCVDETKRGKHVGSELFKEIKKTAKELGAYHITLRVWECNPNARAFYDAMGMKTLYSEMEMLL